MKPTVPLAALAGVALVAGLTACGSDGNGSDRSLGTGAVTGGAQNPSSTTPSTASASGPSAGSTAASGGGSFADRAGIPPRRYTDAAAEIDIPNQSGDGKSVRLGEVRLTRSAGFVAIFTRSGELLGSARVTPAVSPSTVRLDKPVPASGEMQGVLFVDDGDGTFEVTKDRAINDGDTDPDDRLDLEDEDFDYRLN